MKHCTRKRFDLYTILIFFASLLAACGTAAEEPADLVIPTAVDSDEALNAVGVEDKPTQTAVPPATPAPTLTAVATPTPPPTSPQDEEQEATYTVTYVTEDDELNVRAGPGVANDIVGALPPATSGVRITGAGQTVDSSIWVPIAANDLTGWVNRRYLTQEVADSFCEDEVVMALLDDLETAVANQDGDLLAQLVHPERGLRLRVSWWNPEVQFDQEQVRTLFSSETSYDWGIEDGSGEPIEGSFAAVIYPLLESDLLDAAETGCNEILSGGSAGIIRLPDGYEPVDYYSFYRPGSDEYAGLDWGSWVAGIEKWGDGYYLAFLVHYAWEI